MTDYSFDAEKATPGPQPEPEPVAAHALAHHHHQPDQSEPLDEVDVPLLDHVKVLYKRRWTGITIFLLILGSVTVYTFTATPIFEARTRLLIEAENQNVVSFKAVLDGDQTRADYYQTQYNILQSRALARRTLDELKLWDTPPFGGKQGEGFSLKRTILGAPGLLVSYVASGFSRSGGSAGKSPISDNSIPGADETAAQTRAIDAFASNLTVAPIRNSRLVDLRYELPDARLATKIVNALARNYIEQSLEFKFMASKEASDWLGQRLGEQRKQLEQSEAKLQKYREQNDAISLKDRENIVVQKLSDLNGAVTLAKTERFQKEALYRQLESLRGNPATLDTFPAILANTFIQQQKSELAQLQSQYAQMGDKLGPNHPEMVKLRSAIQVAQTKANGEIGKVVEGVKNEYLAALAKENSLAGALNAQKGDALAMNRKAIDYSVLDREVQSGRQLYDSLLQRAKETGVSTELKTSNIRIVDRAERPLGPVSPQKGLDLLLATFGGLLVACGLVFFFEYLDSRIKTPDEIRIHLGLTHLGLLPALDDKTMAAHYPLVSNGVPGNFAEAFRAVRTNVLFSTAQEGSHSIVVTSTGPGEGKTMVASNLAISLAQAGQRTLLIDADMRRPKAHEIFEMSQEPGLSNLLVGNAKASEAVRKSGVAGMWVIPSGRTPPNPAELLGSQRFRDFLASLNEHFDWVIIDSPPVMAVTDAALVAHSASGVVFVVGAEMTSRYAAKSAGDQLRRVHAKFVGAVLNRVDLERNGYYYSQYYRREYGEYYQKTLAS
jgi:capsular exopolysaccharide synthesis family protein